MSGNSQATKPQEFTGLRGILWPVHNHELKKFLPLAMMMFFILFNYTVLRNFKDALIVTAKGSGAEVITFLKVWCVLPAAILFIMLYAKMSKVLSKEKLFYATVAPFLAFFGIFAFFLYPNISVLHPRIETIESLKAAYPNFKFLFPIWGNWTFALFFLMSELWGSVVLSLMFWQFANDITRVTEAKRFYALFGLLGNFSLVAAGRLMIFFSSTSEGNTSAYLNSLTYLVLLSGFLVMVCYWFLQKSVLTDLRFYNPDETKKPKKAKGKLSLKESFSYIFSSKYLGFICLLVVGYGVCINLVEATWKSQLKIQYPTANEYGAFMGRFSELTGWATIFLMIVGSNILRRFRWGTAAMITPLLILATGVGFYFFVIMRDAPSVTALLATLGWTPVYLAVIIGATQNILSKATKYSLFDPTKEMTYIPLDDELKIKGKAAVDVVGGRLGKSGGALVQQLLLIITAGTQLTIVPYVAGIFLVVMVLWILAVRGLNVQFTSLTSQREKEREKAQPESTSLLQTKYTPQES